MRLCANCCAQLLIMWQEVAEVLGSIPSGTTFLSFLLLFQESLEGNGSDYL